MGSYSNEEELKEGLNDALPDVLLLDLSLADKTGKMLASEILEHYPDLKILVLTSMDTPAMVSSMMRRGCIGYVLKGTTTQLLVSAIQSVAAGNIYIEPQLKKQLVLNAISPKKQPTKRKPSFSRAFRKRNRNIEADCRRIYY